MADVTHGYRYIHLFAEPGDHIRRALATIDGRVAEDPFQFEADCRQQLDLLCASASEGRLLLSTARHTVTGAPAYLVYDSCIVGGTELRGLVAEMLPAPDYDWDATVHMFECMATLARRGELSIVAHGLGAHVRAFVTRTVPHGERFRFTYFARLLMTDGELAQWVARGSAARPGA